MRKLSALLAILLAATAFAQNEPQQNKTAPPSDARVTLPLAEYEQLRAPDRPESIAVVDTLRLAGTFKDRNLTVTFIGKSVGKRIATPVLAMSTGLSIWGCSGSAVISRGEKDFRITPLGDTFSATCRIAAAGSDRLELVATPSVLAMESSVPDGELVAGTYSADGSANYSLVRQSAGGAENLAPTATGHYLITLLPDETRFRYAIEVHNPNRSRRPFEVHLRSGEHLQQVDAAAPYEVVDGAYRFDLPPGDTNLVLTGQLSGNDIFVPPVEASLQYLAIENHPVVRPVIDGSVKRISAAEAGVPIQFRGAQAFLLGKGEVLRWRKTNLEALHTVNYALTAARHTFFVPAEGAVLGESIFSVDNQGASDVKLPLRPEPTYASIENEPLLMTKGPDGKLTVPLSAGKQQVLVQHRQSIRSVLGFGVGRLVVPQLDVPASTLLATINYPAHWWPVMQSFSTRIRFWTPSTELLLVFLGLALWTERVLAYLMLPWRRRLVIALLLAAACAVFDAVAVLVAIADACLTIGWLVALVKREKWTFLKVFAAAVAIGVAGIVAIGTYQFRKITKGGDGSYGYASTGTEEASRNVSFVDKEQKAAKTDYQGLPAKFDLPTGERHSSFGQEMLPTDREHAVTVVLVSATIVWLIGAAFLALAWLAVWRARTLLAAGLRARFAAPAPSPVEAVP
ncbi:MAG TPA: hypothetical protein VJZ76_23645 [Thermoanaerobaculia bacterium]|nr:hypothetical protein [Thermoanaerobaculia bacterium]